MKQKPDPEEYARQVLYQLSALSGEVYELKLFLAEVLGHLKNLPATQFHDHWKKEVQETTDRLYDISCKEMKLAPPSEDPPEDPPISPGPKGGRRE